MLLLSLALAAQTPPPPSFDVASVKPSQATDRATSNFPLGPGDAYTPNGGYFSATNYALSTYIGFAYKINGNQAQFFLDQLPAWVSTDHFDIQARVQGNPTKDEMRLMMRTLLAERFKLAIHEETRQVSAAALVLAKPGKLGPQIQPHPADVACPKDADPSLLTPDGRFPLLCGGRLQLPESARGHVRYGARNVTLEFLAKAFTGGTGSERTLVDGTGLSGNFDFSLEWAPEIRGPVKPGEEAPDPSGPSFEEALREQLGFKLEPKKSSVVVLVLDRVEHPSGN
jgi:uncharacterized protein (TIGR03435 family)